MPKELTQASFLTIIQDKIRRECGRMQYKEAIVDYCEKNEIALEDIASLVKGQLKSLLRSEAENLHYLPRTAKLPI